MCKPLVKNRDPGGRRVEAELRVRGEGSEPGTRVHAAATSKNRVSGSKVLDLLAVSTPDELRCT